MGVLQPLHSEETKTDPRLIGVWVSDREKTIQRMRFKEGATPEQKAKIAELFGKLRIEYTAAEVRTDFEGSSESGPYQVIASDKDSVVILGKGMDGPKLMQIHFEPGGYYILSGFIIEFFKRLTP